MRRDPIERLPGPARIERLVVGPERHGRRRAERFDLESDVAAGVVATFASSFSVRPRYDVAGGTGGAGWQEVKIPFAHGDESSMNALVYYPARRNRFGIVREGKGVAVAETREGLPTVLLVHGYWPDQLCSPDHPDTYSGAQCDPELQIPEESLFTLWRSTQDYLARAGYLSIAIDLRWRDCDSDGQLTQTVVAIESAIDWLRGTELFRNAIDTTGVSLVGHSAGAAAVVNAARRRDDVRSLSLLGPAPVLGITDPVLVIGSQQDTSGGTLGAFENADAPRYLLLLSPQVHYGYFDSMCADTEGRLEITEAARMRYLVREALRGMLDRYHRRLASAPLELEVHARAGIEAFCHDLGDGVTCVVGSLL